MKNIERTSNRAVLLAVALASAAGTPGCGGGDTPGGSTASGGTTFDTGGATGTGALGGSGGVSTGGAGGAVTGGAGGGAPVSETEACIRYIEAACERLTQCTAMTFEDCTANNGTKCPDYFFGPGSLRTVDDLLACAEDIRPWSCDITTVPPCISAGSLPGGSACIAPSQCESGSCALTGPTTCATCKALYAPGEDCRLDVDTKTCPRDEVCADSKCVPRSPPSEPGRPADWRLCRCGDPSCSGDAGVPCRSVAEIGEPCSDTQPCHAAATCTAGICAPQGTPGYFAQTCTLP